MCAACTLAQSRVPLLAKNGGVHVHSPIERVERVDEDRSHGHEGGCADGSVRDAVQKESASYSHVLSCAAPLQERREQQLVDAAEQRQADERVLKVHAGFGGLMCVGGGGVAGRVHGGPGPPRGAVGLITGGTILFRPSLRRFNKKTHF